MKSPNKQLAVMANPPKIIVDLTRRIAPIVSIGYRYRSIVVLVITCLVAFGVYSLHEMNKNEFPPFTVREGLVVAAYPGATTEQLEQEVMKPLEDYVFSFKEVDKAKTHADARGGMVYVYVELDDKVTDTETFWNKFKIGVDQAKQKLPSGVLAVVTMSDFGDASALLITMSSRDKTYRELHDFMEELRDRLRPIESIGKMTVTGEQTEQISIYLDPQRLSHYGIGEKEIALALATQGFNTTGGELRTPRYDAPIVVERPLGSVADVSRQVVMATPGGDVVRLADVADVKREYPTPSSFVTNNGLRSIVLSIEVKSGHNVVTMGQAVEKQIAEFEGGLPDDVEIFRITNQPLDVNSSVTYFLTELLIAIIAVVIAIMLLLPLRVALIAAATIPISIFVSLSLFYMFGIEINTVTLAVLIVSLGMIVDNSVVIIDNYEELLSDGVEPKLASLSSATEFFKAIVAATLAISVTFFPFLITMTGMFRDFLTDFPWAISIILFVSLIVAELLVPFLQVKFIRKAPKADAAKVWRKHFTILGFLQAGYNHLIDFCFRFPKSVLAVGLVTIGLGFWLLLSRPLKLMPVAERNQFAVEIRMPTGTPLARTSAVADSLAGILRADKRVVSVAIFHGASSPRFQTTYAPQVGGSDYAQFIVNTESNQATIDVLNEYTPRYSTFFPDARVRFKQLSYSQATNPIEIRLSGPDYAVLQRLADSVATVMKATPGIALTRLSTGEPQVVAAVEPDFVNLSRLGLNATTLEASLAMRYTSGLPVASVWDGDYSIPVVLKAPTANSGTIAGLRDQRLSPLPTVSVPLDQVARVVPAFHPGTLSHRAGVRTVTVEAEVDRGEYAMPLTSELRRTFDTMPLPPSYKLDYGGEWEDTMDILPHLLTALAMASAIIFFILLFYYKKVRIALLLVICLITTIPGAAIGLLIQNSVLSLTCTLGLISLMGIMVRNIIILLDYAKELRAKEGMSVGDATLASCKRRMRPIFLTSSAASMGVIPMMLSDSALWQPMGAVIFWGTLITMVYILTFIPIAYWKTAPKDGYVEPDSFVPPPPTPGLGPVMVPAATGSATPAGSTSTTNTTSSSTPKA